MNTYRVTRDWGGEYAGETTKYFTTDKLQQLSVLLDAVESELGDIITGLNCDSYADLCVDVVGEYMETEGDIDSVVYMLCDKHLSEAFDTCYTWYRCLNMQLTDTEAETMWKEACVTECEAWLENQ